MKIKRHSSVFEPRRRSLNIPIVPITLAILIVASLAFFWSRGGEQPQQRVEKAIPAERLGK